MALPISDAIFVERSAKTVTRVSAKLVDAMKNHGAVLTRYPQLRGMSTLARPRSVEYTDSKRQPA